MAKKRNCRRTETERAAHDMAVSMRKMPDKQLVDMFSEEYDRGYADGCIAGQTGEPLAERLKGKKGFGPVTINCILEILKEIAEPD